jgi:hypothetical protein
VDEGLPVMFEQLFEVHNDSRMSILYGGAFLTPT